jgi:hypothetical protein
MWTTSIWTTCIVSIVDFIETLSSVAVRIRRTVSIVGALLAKVGSAGARFSHALHIAFDSGCDIVDRGRSNILVAPVLRVPTTPCGLVAGRGCCNDRIVVIAVGGKVNKCA